MTQNFLTLGWWNLVGLQGWLSILLKLHHVAHLWWVLMFDIFLYWSQLQPVMKCNQPYTAERRNMLRNMSPRNRRFAKTGTLHPEARHIVCQLCQCVKINIFVLSKKERNMPLVWNPKKERNPRNINKRKENTFRTSLWIALLIKGDWQKTDIVCGPSQDRCLDGSLLPLTSPPVTQISHRPVTQILH